MGVQTSPHKRKTVLVYLIAEEKSIVDKCKIQVLDSENMYSASDVVLSSQYYIVER